MHVINSFKRIIFLKFFFISLLLFSQEKTLTTEYAKKIAAGQIRLEGNKYDTLLFGQPILYPDGDEDNDGLTNKQEIYIYTKRGIDYIGYYSHPRLADTDGDGIIDSKEKINRRGKNRKEREASKLLWDISSRDMAMFMRLAYREDDYVNHVLDANISNADFKPFIERGKEQKEYRMMHNELAPYWTAKKFYHLDSGFDAILLEYRTKFPFIQNGKLQVLAIRGTDKGGDGDFNSDASLAFGRPPAQLYDLIEILKEYNNDRNINNLYTSGHSLGGYLAQAAAAIGRIESYSWLKNAYTFNAPKLKAGIAQPSWFKRIRDKSDEISYSGESFHFVTSDDIVTGATKAFPNYISVGRGGHYASSFFQENVGNLKDENGEYYFIRGKRNTMHQIGYRDPQIDKLDIIELDLDKDKYNIATDIITKYVGVYATYEELKNAINFIPKNSNIGPYTKGYEIRLNGYPAISLEDYPKDIVLPIEVLYQDKGIEYANITVRYILDTRALEPLKTTVEEELSLINNLDLEEKPDQAVTDVNNIKADISEILDKIQILTTKTPEEEYRKYNQQNVNDFVAEINSKITEIKKLRKKIEITPVVNSITNKDTHITGFGISGLPVSINNGSTQIGQVNINNVDAFDLSLNNTLSVGERIIVKTTITDAELGEIESYPIEVIVIEKMDIDDGYYNGRIGINTDKPRATLDIRETPINQLPEGTVQGVTFPKFTTEQRDRFQNVKPGTMIYNSTQKCIDLYVGDGVWNCLEFR